MWFKYPYTSYSELNLDWFLEQFKKLKDEWDTTSGEWDQMQLDFQTLEGTVQTFTTFVTHYFDNLDVQQEINNKLDALVADGTLSTLLAPLVEANIGDAVAAQIGDTVADQIDDTVADQINSVVADQIVDAVAPSVPSAVTTWLDANVDPVGSAVTIDKSLSISGSAADAKVTGDCITSGSISLYTDLSTWYNAYFKANGAHTNTNKRITPLATPFLLTAGDSIVINPGTGWTVAVGIYSYNPDTQVYTRASVTGYETTTTLLYTEDHYIAFDFGVVVPEGQTPPNITPSDFIGSITAPTAWKEQIASNTARITVLENEFRYVSPLYGKKLVACGDSITVGSDPGGGFFDTYSKIAAERNGMTYAANAVSGSTMTNVAGKHPFCVDRYQEVPNDFDYLTIWFGWNDGAYATVGTINDNVDTTFYGAYKKVMDYFLTEYPDKKIGLIVPYMSNTAFQQAVRDISAMYGVPCLDLPDSHVCSLVYGTANAAQEARRTALLYDGTHPNQDGHNFIATMYEQFLLRL